jgi:hypothetical protein
VLAFALGDDAITPERAGVVAHDPFERHIQRV